MKIRALKAFTIRDSETGNLTSIANGEIAEVSDTLGSSLISNGLAEAYTLISPTGSIEITSNGTVDVAEYASAVVNVPDFKNLVERTITSVTADMLAGFTKIGYAAFASCSSLTSVTIPNSVTGIETQAFAGCPLTSVTMLSTTPFAIDTEVFLDVENFDIYVPAESVEAYKATSGWSYFADQIQAIQE